jgi:long-chain acyl-CoA synthetase
VDVDVKEDAVTQRTLVSIYFANADRLGAAPCFWFHHAGTWVPISWRQSARLTRDFAAGLLDLGHQPGDALSVLANTRHEWMCADIGNLAVGGVTVGVYPTMTGEQSKYVVAHSDSRWLMVEDAKLYKKIEPHFGELPRLETVIVVDPAGVPSRPHGGAGKPAIVSFTEVIARGQTSRRGHEVDARAAKLRLEDAAIFVYTSGTTGPPKAAMLTHGNIMAALEEFEAMPIRPDDTGFSFLPLGHVLQRMVNYRGIHHGISGAFARSLDTVADDIGASRPSVVASVPRIFEKIYQKINEQAAAGSPAKQKIFAWAVGVGRQVSKLRRDHQPVPPALEVQHRVASKLVFEKLRARLGGRIRVFVTGGAPIAKEILEFFDAAEITICEGWGMTETCAAGTLNLPGAQRFGSIGRPLPGVDMKLDEDGEILIKGGNVFAGYYKDEEATRTSFTADGYFRTGDIGRVDADGYWYIVDRKKDLIITAHGKNVAPQNIENHVKTDPRISQIVAIGDRQPFLVALVAVSPEARQGKSDAELTKMVEGILAEKNKDLASYERIKKFRLLSRELTIEDGEITPTLKVKRKVVGEKYKRLIDEMYAEKKEGGEARSAGSA